MKSPLCSNDYKLTPANLILASASPRRRELLAQAGYTFTVEAADVDESERPGESPADYVRRLAEEKAQAVFARHQSPGAPFVTAPSSRVGSDNLIVLGADTTVVCAGQILAKPADAADARRMLEHLSGRTHQVLTGIAAATRTGVVSAVESTDVTFTEIPADELAIYCATAEPLDKAGAYGIQGYAARWIPRIDGDYFNVMGLPIARTVRLIAEATSAEPSYAGVVADRRNEAL
jgi:septum formation protein